MNNFPLQVRFGAETFGFRGDEQESNGSAVPSCRVFGEGKSHQCERGRCSVR